MTAGSVRQELAVDPAVGVRSKRQLRWRRGPKLHFNRAATTVLSIGTLVILIPLYFVLAMALKSQGQTAGSGFSFPFPFDFQNFVDAWSAVDFPRALMWSVVVTAITVVGSILVPAMAAWAVVRNWNVRIFRLAFIYLLAAMFIPFTVVALPQIKLTAELHLDNPLGVAILHIMFGLGFNTLLFAAYVRSLPIELEESGTIDGASQFQIFRRVVLPLVRPMSATIGIFAFLGSWNDYMMPSLITVSNAQQTLPVVQEVNQATLSLNYNVAFASYALAMIPAIVGYLIGQRWIIAGVMRGAIK